MPYTPGLTPCAGSKLARDEGMATSGGGFIRVTFRVHEEEGQYVGRCVELGVSSCAKSSAKALARAQEATILYLNTLEEVGERERVLAEAGITIVSEQSHDPVSICAYPDDELTALRNVKVPSFSYA
jgi:predicted RNase H-like HicB family nuclease